MHCCQQPSSIEQQIVERKAIHYKNYFKKLLNTKIMTIPKYESFEDKEKHFDVYKSEKVKCTIDTKSELDTFYEKIIEQKNDDWIFRGVNEASYKQYSSFQKSLLEGRIVEEKKNTPKTISLFVEKEINSLKSNKSLSDYYKAMNIPVTDFLYISLLQHYGALTPFIDYTYNPYVALYFATEGLIFGKGTSQKTDIGDYFSIYWISRKNNNRLNNLSDYYVDEYLKAENCFFETRGNKIDFSKFLFWKGSENDCKGLDSLQVGFIDGNYTKYPIIDYQHEAITLLKDITVTMQRTEKKGIYR